MISYKSYSKRLSLNGKAKPIYNKHSLARKRRASIFNVVFFTLYGDSPFLFYHNLKSFRSAII